MDLKIVAHVLVNTIFALLDVMRVSTNLNQIELRVSSQWRRPVNLQVCPFRISDISAGR